MKIDLKLALVCYSDWENLREEQFSDLETHTEYKWGILLNICLFKTVMQYVPLRVLVNKWKCLKSVWCFVCKWS